MADTRSAHPDYRLDVDLMILEYLLHHALQSQFRQLTSPPQSPEVLDTSNYELHTHGDELLAMFNAFIQIFRANYPNHALDGGINFNIIVLEAIMLLNMRDEEGALIQVTNTLGSKRATQPITNQFRWLSETQRQCEERRTWLDLRSKAWARQAKQPLTIVFHQPDFEDECRNLSSWSEARPEEHSNRSLALLSPLFAFLHRFMILSAEVSAHTGEINEKWMTIAFDLMRQTALDTLDIPASTYSSSDADYAHPHPSLQQVFAFGFIPHLPPPNQPEEPKDSLSIATRLYITQTTHAINDMFSATPTTDVSSPQPIENPTWTSLRHALIREFTLHTHTIPSRSARLQQLSRVRSKHPYPQLRTNLIRCLEHFWAINVTNITGTPDLVQIESGKLDGLNDEEFRQFLVRCGIQRDEDSKLKGNVRAGLDLKSSLLMALFPSHEEPGKSRKS